jgi:hypothetical protein
MCPPKTTRRYLHLICIWIIICIVHHLLDFRGVRALHFLLAALGVGAVVPQVAFEDTPLLPVRLNPKDDIVLVFFDHTVSCRQHDVLSDESPPAEGKVWHKGACASPVVRDTYSWYLSGSAGLPPMMRSLSSALLTRATQKSARATARCTARTNRKKPRVPAEEQGQSIEEGI